MEKDWLDKIIEENRAAFEHGSPPASAWGVIEEELGKKKNKPKVIFLTLRKLAAIFIGIMVAGVVIGKVYFSRSTQGIDPAYATELKLVEDHFDREVGLKIDEAKSNNVFSGDVANDIAQLDRVFLELREEMLRKKDINNEELMSEMIKNYQLRISLLETLIKKHALIKKRSNHQQMMPNKIEENIKI